MPDRLTVHRTEPADPGTAAAVDLAIPSDVAVVEGAVALMARHCFAGVAPCARTAFRLRVTLAEAISNAILRGNGADPSKRVWIRAELSDRVIRLSVSDEGQGLDAGLRAATCLPADTDSDGGRGLFIIRNLADQVEFNDRGNTIWMTLPRC